MQIMWFLSGASARLLGLLGLAAAGILALNAVEQGTGDPVALATMVTLALFCLVKSAQFLLPRTHLSTLQRTSGAWSRTAFLLVSLGWLLLSGFVILEFGRQTGVAPPLARALLGLVGVALVLFLIFFLLGASYRVVEAHHADAPDPNEPPVEYFARSPMTSDAPPPRQLPKRYQTMVVDPRQRLRPRDVWDYYGTFILALAVIGGFVAFRFSNTVQTPELNGLIETHLRLIFVGITLMFAAPLVLTATLRAPASRGFERIGLLKRLFFILVSMPALGAVLTMVLPFDLAPHIWHMVTTHEPATLVYQVVEIESYGVLGDCARLSPVGATDQQVMTCALDPEIMASIGPGSRLEATGPLSDYAHSLVDVAVLP